MNLKKTITKLDHNQRFPYAFIRIFLGVALLIRGIFIFLNPDAILEIASKENLFIWYVYIAIAHAVGGILIAIGFFSRLGALIQIPILFSALFFVHAKDDLMMGGQSFELAAMVLFLLCIYFVYGAGPLSVHQYFKKDF